MEPVAIASSTAGANDHRLEGWKAKGRSLELTDHQRLSHCVGRHQVSFAATHADVVSSSETATTGARYSSAKEGLIKKLVRKEGPLRSGPVSSLTSPFSSPYPQASFITRFIDHRKAQPQAHYQIPVSRPFNL
ncbi:unnamed protein product [Linum trigynum]|uniref:Uncharacterized protein n=1 Tax=Linum trigynum TaxID=586398 RepID=A0AAV2DU18_9ROSI